MKVILRLYRRHDLDLIALYNNKSFGFQQTLRNALRAYAKGENYLIYPPECKINYTKKSATDFNYSYTVHLILDSVYDKDIIDFLGKVKKGLRNEFIKIVLRNCIVGPTYSICLNDDKERTVANNLIEQLKKKIIFYNTPERNRSGVKNNTKKIINIVDFNKTEDTPEGIADAIKTSSQNPRTSALNHQNDTIKNAEKSANNTADDVTNNIKSNNASNNTNNTMLNSATAKEDDPFGGITVSNSVNNLPPSNDNNSEDDSFDLFGDIQSMLTNFNS